MGGRLALLASWVPVFDTMLLREPGVDRTQGGMFARLRGLAMAFCVMMAVTFTLVGFMSGMLLMAESFDDTRKAGLDAWNADVSDWNSDARAEFQKLGSTMMVNGKSLQPSTKSEIYDLLMANDDEPDELLKPDPLFYTTNDVISKLQNIQPDSTLEVVVASGSKTTTVTVPLIFKEVRCRYVQRGKMSRQVCESHFFGLQKICVKVNEQGVPTKNLVSVTGASTDVGCFLGTEGMYRSRQSHLWAPGLYTEFGTEAEVVLPKEISIVVRSNTDPALTASIYTAGFYDFGQSPGDKFSTGLVVFIISNISLCFFISMCTLQYLWPQAPNYAERSKYFYRRYLRHRHTSFNAWSTRTFGAEPVPMEEIPAEELLLEQQAREAREQIPDPDWQGPRDGGHRLGGPMPPLVQSTV